MNKLNEVMANNCYEPDAAQVDAIERAAESKLPGVAAMETTVAIVIERAND